MDQQLQDLIEQLSQLTPVLRTMSSTGASKASTNLDRQFDRIVQALARLNTTLNAANKTELARKRSIDDFVKSVDRAADAQDDYRKAVSDITEATEAAAAAELKAARDIEEAARRDTRTRAEIRAEERTQQRTQNREALKELARKREQNTNYASLVAKEEMEQRRAGTTFRAGLEKLAGESVQGQKTVARVMVSLEELGKLGASLGKFAGELGQGNTKFTTLNPLIDSVTAALGKMAEAIPFAGSAISGGMKLVAEGTKFIINQLQTSVDAFQELSSVGALTTEGIRGVQKQFLESGMTLEGYKRTVQENSAALARFGGTVGDGTRRFTKFVGSIVDSEAGDELRRLGFSADTIGESAAAFVTQQTRLGLSQRKSNAQLAAGAAEYARELDQLSKLTGMQRKDIQAQQDAALSEGRFRAKYDEMVASGQEKQAKAMLDFQTMVSKAAPEMGAGLRDMAAGFVNSEAAQKLFADTGGAAAGILERLKSGQIDQVQAFRELQEATARQMGTARELAKATGDSAGVMTNYAQKSDFLNAKIIDGQVELERQQRKQMEKGTEPLTDSATQAQKSMEQMSRQIQNFGFAVMPKAADAVQQFTGALNEFVKGVAKATGIALPNIVEGGQAVSKSMTETRTAVDQAKTAVDIALDPDRVIANQQQRDAAIKKQDEENFEKATLGEKASVLAARGVEKAGEALGWLASTVGMEGVGKRLSAAAGEARASRVASDTAHLASTGRAPAAAAGGATTAMGQQQLADMGIRIKQGDVQADGAQISPKLIELAKNIQSSVPGFSYFSGFNDRFHQENSPMSKHTAGLAADFVLQSHPTREEGERIAAMLRNMGASKVLDEYNSPSAKATGGHFHVEIPAMAKGGITQGPTMAGEAGPEAVVPLPDGKKIPVKLFQDTGPTFAGYNEYLGYNQGPMSTDLATLKAISEKLGAFDRATNTITDPAVWKEVMKSGIATNYEVAGMKLGSATGGGFQNELAAMVESLKNEGLSTSDALQATLDRFRTDMQEAVRTMSGPGGEGLMQMMSELIALQKRSNVTSERLLQTAAN